jgi:cytochrome c oxidase subunit III
MELTAKRQLDVSQLPTVVFGPRSMIWVGNILYMTIEGTVAIMLFVSYFYLRTRTPDWPSGLPDPDLTWGTLNGAVLVLSLLPAWYVKRRARAGDLQGTQRGLLLMLFFAVVSVILRVFEFPGLNCRWDENAYASISWAILGNHTIHLVTDLLDTAALTVFAFSSRMEGNGFMDIYENSDYWYFVVGMGLLSGLVLYAAPRLL